MNHYPLLILTNYKHFKIKHTLHLAVKFIINDERFVYTHLKLDYLANDSL